MSSFIFFPSRTIKSQACTKLFQFIRGTVVRWTLRQDSSSFAALPVTCDGHRLRKLQSHQEKRRRSHFH